MIEPALRDRIMAAYVGRLLHTATGNGRIARRITDVTSLERGAEVRVIYQEAVTPPAEERPWRSIRQPMPFDEGWVLTIEKFEE